MIIDGILDLDRESEHPRTYEVGQLIKNVDRCNRETW